MVRFHTRIQQTFANITARDDGPPCRLVCVLVTAAGAFVVAPLSVSHSASPMPTRQTAVAAGGFS